MVKSFKEVFKESLIQQKYNITHARTRIVLKQPDMIVIG